MSLQFIIGNSGSGKSYYLYKHIIEQSIALPDKNYLVIVPEQFTMQTQKDLVWMHPNKGIMNIDVLSFQRLAYRIFEEVGYTDKKILEETGKNLILRKIAGERQDELKILGGNLKKIGYISELKSMISELTQYGIGSAGMDEMLQLSKNRPGLHQKLEDLQVVYEGFGNYLEDKYITTEEILDVLAGVVGRSDILKNSEIALDGFTGFTPVQNKLLERLMMTADKISVTVTADAREDAFTLDEDYRLFHMSKKTISGLCQIAKEAEVKIEESILLGKEEVYRFRDREALKFLERNLFRYSRKVYTEEQEEIEIHEAVNPKEEAVFLGRTIRQLIRTKHYRYKDIAVITGDMEGYCNHIEKALETFRIPCFIDHKRSILLNPFIEFIRAALEMTDKNFDYESTFRFLRCGLLDFTNEEIDKMENYVLALGIRGQKRWNAKWIRVYKGLEEEHLTELNRLRVRFTKQTEALVAVLKSKNETIAGYTKALYEFIVAHQMQLKLKVYEEKFQAEGQMTMAKEYSQIYRIVIELFDKIIELIGDERISLREYREILDAGFEEAKVGVIPPSIDQVMVGDIQRTRLKDIKVLFFLGVNDGIIPSGGGSGGIISELDREFLADNQIKLAPTMRENSYIQKLYLYLNLTKPTEQLILSYSRVSMSGDGLRPSYLIHSIKSMYSALEIIEEDVFDSLISRVESPESGIQLLIEGLEEAKAGQASAEWMELFCWYFSDEQWNPKVLSLVEAAFTTYASTALGRAASKALYGTTLVNSVTRLEKFAECAFAHFLQYGLILWEREEYGFAAVDMGNVFHRALEIFSNKLESSEYNWLNLPDEKREQILEVSVEEAVVDYGNTVLYSSARNKYMIQRIKRMIGRTVWALGEQMKRGKFLPSHYEVSFAMEEDLDAVNIMLSDNEKMKLKGRIDRTDTYEKDDQVYVKVIDYKSGNKDFDIVALYHGLQLQLVVYLNAAMELTKKEHPGKEILPAGIFYYNMKDPMIDKEQAENIQENLLKELRMKGLVNNDPEVISYMDDRIEGTSAVLPISKTAKGTLRKSDALVSDKQFQALSGYVNKKMKAIGDQILNGEMAVKPYELEKSTACDYCSFSGICGFDKKIPGYEFRRLQKYKAEEVWDRITDREEK